MKKRVVITLGMAWVFAISTMTFPLIRTAQAGALPREAAAELKSLLLNQLAQTYNKLVDLSEEDVRGSLLDDLFAQEREMLSRAQALEEASAREEVMSSVTARVNELRENISGLSKAQILENLLVAQEELSHLGVEQVLKGIVAVLVSVAMVPVFVVGAVLVVVGATVTTVTLGLLAPIGGAIMFVGLVIAGGALVTSGATWTWAMEPGL